jgi:hypothetical protein
MPGKTGFVWAFVTLESVRTAIVSGRSAAFTDRANEISEKRFVFIESPLGGLCLLEDSLTFFKHFVAVKPEGAPDPLIRFAGVTSKDAGP